jgi:hypothetical protein
MPYDLYGFDRFKRYNKNYPNPNFKISLKPLPAQDLKHFVNFRNKKKDNLRDYPLTMSLLRFIIGKQV